jgi:hypothetical protein
VAEDGADESREELRSVAVNFWRAVQQMVWRHEHRDERGDSDDLDPSGVPRQPAPDAGHAAAAAEEPDGDD